MQEPGFLAELGIKPADFWGDVYAQSKRHDIDPVISYLQLMLAVSDKRGVKLTKKSLSRWGRAVVFFDGVDRWFSRIDRFSKTLNLELEHYIISSGIEDMIAGTAIAKHFRKLFASKFIFDKAGQATAPGVAINYTTKTQYLFRINKGILNHWDSAGVNRWQAPQVRPIPFERMIFIGDGETDIPAMKLVRSRGGCSVGVFDPVRWGENEVQSHIHRLIAENRVNYVAPADYCAGSQLDVLVKGALTRMQRELL